MSVRTVHKTCNICEAACGLRVEVRGNAVTRIRPDVDDPLSRGHICPKAMGLKQIQEDPDRLRVPQRRRRAEGDRSLSNSGSSSSSPSPASHWDRVEWEEALELAASRLVEVQRQHGDDAVGFYLGNPTAHSLGALLYVTLIRQALGTRNWYTASSLDQNPKHASCHFFFGNTLSIPVPDVDRTDYLLVLGANPVVSGGSLMTAPGFAKRVRRLQERGGKLVVIDPRRSETAHIADAHHFIRPGRDALMLCALLQVIFEEGRVAKSRALALSDGLDFLREKVARYPPERVADSVGIEAETLRMLARDFAGAERAVCYGRVGTCTSPFGTLSNWLIDALNLVTGNLDEVGGAMFPTPAADLAGLLAKRGPSPGPGVERTRVRRAPCFNDERPTACLAEEMTTPGEGQIRALLTLAGNPALSAPNAGAVAQGLSQLDFFAAIDIYCNETTRHADVILPPPASLEQDNYELLFHGFAVRNTAKFSPRVLTPPAGALEEWRIVSQLALRILEKKARAAGSWQAPLWWALRRFSLVPGPRRLLDWMFRIGPHGDGFRPWRRGLRLRDLLARPGGVDLGPLESRLPGILQTPGGRIELAQPILEPEFDQLEAELGETGERSLRLIGRRDVRTNNSWLHNVPLSAKGRERCTLLMHERDAKECGVSEGQRVRVRSRVGEVSAAVEISANVMPGVVSLPHGWGHSEPGARLSTASRRPGVNCNRLCDDGALEGIVANAIFNGVPVTVEPVGSSEERGA